MANEPENLLPASFNQPQSNAATQHPASGDPIGDLIDRLEREGALDEPHSNAPRQAATEERPRHTGLFSGENPRIRLIPLSSPPTPQHPVSGDPIGDIIARLEREGALDEPHSNATQHRAHGQSNDIDPAVHKAGAPDGLDPAALGEATAAGRLVARAAEGAKAALDNGTPPPASPSKNGYNR